MKQVTRTLAILAATLSLLAASLNGTANAGPRNDMGKRDVIPEAVALCGLGADAPAAVPLPLASVEETQAFACLTLWKTNGTQDTNTRGCDVVRDDTADGFAAADNGAVIYSGRNCDTNEEALERKMSAVVVSLDDVITRGKDQQKETAALAVCSYAAKVYDLVGAGKLDQGDEDLAADGEAIAAALGFACE